MTAEPRILRTDAEAALIAAYEGVRDRLPGNAAVQGMRAEAFARFRANGLPHRRVEEWKYTDLRALLREVPPIAGRVSEKEAAAALALAPDRLGGLERFRLILVDGHFMPGLSDLGPLLLEGVEVEGTALLLASESAGKVVMTLPALVAADAAVSLNTALVGDGVAIVVRPGVQLSRPLEILHVSTGVEASAFTRDAVIVGAGAALRVVEVHVGRDGVASHANALTYVDVGANARLDWSKLQAAGDRSSHLGSLVATTGSAARLNHLTVTTGGSLSRSQSFVTIAGEGAEINLNGATMIGGEQHADITLTLNHAKPGSKSRVLFKNVADGSADGVFQGKIVVAQEAQKTDGKMMAKQLLLSDDAAFVSKPELEIYADDVQCGHGSTSGRIDENMLFYFLSRGIPRPDAERLLLQSFLADAIEALEDEEVGAALEGVIEDWLSRRTPGQVSASNGTVAE